MIRNATAIVLLGLVVLASLSLGDPPPSSATPADEQLQSSLISVPEPLRIEHEHLHETLRRATQAGGETGEAAKDVAAVLKPHFEEENRIALPPLGLLSALAEGEVTDEMRQVLPLTDELQQKLPQMLDEHRQIKAALEKLSAAARKENKSDVADFAERLILHARTEEEVLYPAALLVGEYVRLKLDQQQ